MLALTNGWMFATRFIPSNSVVGRYRASIAGWLGSLSLLLAPAGIRSSFALFTAVRALEVQAQMAAKRGIVPTVEHGDVCLMSAASAVVMAAFVMTPFTMEKGYLRFLNTHLQTPPVNVATLRQMTRGETIDLRPLNALRTQAVPPLAPLEPSFALPAHYDARVGPNADTLDSFSRLLYPGQWTVVYAVQRWLRGFRLAVPVYVPVYLTSTLIFSLGRTIRAPLASLKRVLNGIAVSSAFLTTCVRVLCCAVRERERERERRREILVLTWTHRGVHPPP